MAYNRGRLIGSSGITTSNTNSSGIFYSSEVAPLIEDLSFNAKDDFFLRYINKKGGLTNTWQINSADSTYGTYYDPTNCPFIMSDDGTRLYILRRNQMVIDQYTCKIAGDANSMVYVASFHIKGVTAQAETNVYGFTLTNSGTLLVMHGITLDDVFSYELTTAWDITSVDTSTIKRSTDWNTNYIYSITFNSTGTKMFTAGNLDATIKEHTLSTAWDVSTLDTFANAIDLADYATTPEHSNANLPYPMGHQWNDDGTKLFVSYLRRETRIYEYSLSTAYDLTSATFSEQHEMGTWENYGAFNFFQITNNGKSFVYKNTVSDPQFFGTYELQVPWDLNSSPWQQFHVLENLPAYAGIQFSPDGTKAWYCTYTDSASIGRANIVEAALQTAWDANTIYYTGKSFDAHAIGYNIWAFCWGNSGNYLYAVSTYTEFLGRWEASTPYDITTLSDDYTSIYLNDETDVRGISFNSDGTKMQLSGVSDDAFNLYTLSTAWDITTATYSAGPVLQPGAKNYGQHQFSSDGTKVFWINYTDDSVYEWPLSTAYDPSTNTADPTIFSVTTEEATPSGLAFKTDGTKMYIYGATQQEIHGYDLSTAWDISTATYTSQEQNENYIHGLYLANTGQHMFVTDYDGGKIWRISTTANNIFDSRANTDMYFDVSAQSANPQDVHFKSDGTEMFVLQYNDQYIDKYTLSTAWDITTATYDSTSTTLGASSAGIRGFTMTEDGTKLFVISTTADDIHRFDLSTAYDVNSAVKHSGELQVYDGDYSGLWISKDGKRIYTCVRNEAMMVQFTLDTAYDLSTSNNQQQVVLNHSTYRDPDLGGIAFTNSGNTFYVSSMGAGQNDWRTSWNGDSTVAYRLDTNWDMATTRPLWQTSADFYRHGTTNTDRGVAPTGDGGVVLCGDQNPGAGLFQFTGTTRDNSSNTSVLPSTITGSALTLNREIYDRAVCNKDVSFYAQDLYDCGFGDGGNKFYILNQGGYAFIQQFRCPTAYQIADMVYEKTLNLESRFAYEFTSVNPGSVYGFDFANEGTQMLIIDGGGDIICNYDLAVAWDIGSGTAAGQVDVTTPEGTPRSAFFNKSGDQLYIMGTNTDKINVFKCTSAFNVNTATYTTGDQIDISPRTSEVWHMRFTPDFSKVVYLDYYYYIRETAIGSSNGTIVTTQTPVANTNNNSGMCRWQAYGSPATYTYVNNDYSQKCVQWDYDGEVAFMKTYVTGTGTGPTCRYVRFKNAFLTSYSVVNSTNIEKYSQTLQNNLNAFGQGNSSIFSSELYNEGSSSGSTRTLGYSNDPQGSGRMDGYGPIVVWAMPFKIPVSPQGTGGGHYGLWNPGSDKRIDEFTVHSYNYYQNFCGPYRTYTKGTNNSKITYSSTYFTFTNGANRHGLSFKRDGSKIYTSDINGIVYENNLSTPWDISTIDSASTPVGSYDTGIYIRAFDIDNKGQYLFAVVDQSTALYVYKFGTPWDITTLSYITTVYFPVTLAWSVSARRDNVTVTARDWSLTDYNNLVMILDFSSLN